MKWNFKNINLVIMIIALIITLIGLITGWYFFIFLFIPLGMFWKRSARDDD